MRLLWLPSVLRAAGLTVHEQPGWQTRGSEPFDPYGMIAHATAGKLDVASDIRVLLTGSSTAPPPIAQLFLARTGEWWVIASGRCNHALTGWAGLLKGYGNTRLLGCEAANDNRGEPWPKVQYDSYVTGFAAICKHMGWDPSRRISGHKEHQPAGYPGKTSTKTDPTFDMGTFRTNVIARLTTPGEDMTPEQDRMLYNLDRLNTALLTGKDTVTGLRLQDGTYTDLPLQVVKDVADLKTRPPAELTAEQLQTLGQQLLTSLGDVVEAKMREVLREGTEG